MYSLHLRRRGDVSIKLNEQIEAEKTHLLIHSAPSPTPKPSTVLLPPSLSLLRIAAAPGKLAL